jgi:hypothetical protein
MEVEDHTTWEPVRQAIDAAPLSALGGTCGEALARFCAACGLPYPPKPIATPLCCRILARALALRAAERGLR